MTIYFDLEDACRTLTSKLTKVVYLELVGNLTKLRSVWPTEPSY